MSETPDPKLPVYVKVDKDNVARKGEKEPGDTKKNPPRGEGVANPGDFQSRVMTDAEVAKDRSDLDAQAAAQKKAEQEASNKRYMDDAFELCRQLGEQKLKPAGIEVLSECEDGKWMYYVIFTHRVGPFDTSIGGTKEAMLLLEKLRETGLVK